MVAQEQMLKIESHKPVHSVLTVLTATNKVENG